LQESSESVPSVTVCCVKKPLCMVPRKNKETKQYDTVAASKLVGYYCGFEQSGLEAIEWCPKQRSLGTEPKSPATTTT
jgi:hypothetical protein